MLVTENDLLAELTNELTLEKRLPGDVSAQDLAKSTGIGRRRCSDILNEKAEKGLLKRVEVRSETKGGQPMFVYRKP